MMIPNYDRWKLDDGIGIEKVACKCEGCDEEIYVGHEAFKTDDGLFCDLDGSWNL